MNTFSDFAKRAHKVIQQLRKETLRNGEPFMVYDKSLPEGQYYMEYPDGDIKIVSISKKINDFIEVGNELTVQEVHDLRHRLELPAVF